MHFGTTLRLLRLDAGFTLRDLAERIGVSNAYLSRVENGHDAPPSPDRLVMLARALHVPPATLIGLADRFVPFATDYLERMPAAKELMVEIVRRNPSPLDLARIRAFVDRELPDPHPDRGERWPARFFAAERVVVGLGCDELDDAIDIAAMRLAPELKGASALELARLIRVRERACASALGGGLAIPHARLAGARPRSLVVTLDEPIDGAAPDGLPLRLLVVHVHAGGAAHTTLLSRLAQLAHQDVVDRICGELRPDRVIDAICAAPGLPGS